ncbi:hypothetical protein Tco_0581264 [Tanacetum coccineum]
MISLFSVDAICSVCRKARLDFFGEHAVHCKELPGFKYRHDMVRDVLFDICRRAGIYVKKEAPVNVLVFGWVGGKHACVDLTGVSPLVGLSSRGFTAGHAALKAASFKVTKHEKSCIDNQHVFILFAFNTFGFLALEAVKLLSRVQRVMHCNVMTPRSTDVIFKRIDFAIQKGLTAWLVARLPSTTIYAPSIGKAECSNRKFLTENMKVLAGKIKVFEATLEMEMHPENHTLDSAALLHELYNDM